MTWTDGSAFPFLECQEHHIVRFLPREAYLTYVGGFERQDVTDELTSR
jgi:hypothetical protein